MSSKYTYAATRVKVLEQKLLSETQMEMLLSAKSIPETIKVLQSTYLAPFLASQNQIDVTTALDNNILNAKQLLVSIVPDPEILDILWVKYDYHNLKVIIKGERGHIEDNQILELCFHGGIYQPEELLEHYHKNTLAQLSLFFDEAKSEAKKTSRIFEIDIAMNIFYFKHIKSLAKKCKNTFAREFVRLQIDLFNIKMALRSHSLGLFDYTKVFVEGGIFSDNDLKDKESIFLSLQKLGGKKIWKEAVQVFEENGSFASFEKIADDYLASFLKSKSNNVFSVAPIFSYFNAQKKNAQTIGTILSAKYSGMKEKELRTILRRVYT